MQSKLSKPVLAIFLFLLLTLTLFFISLDRAKIVESKMQNKSAEFALGVSETLRLSVENLQTLSNVLVYFKDINYEQFKGVAGQYFEADDALLILEWQPIVKHANRNEFVSRIQQSGIEDFHLWEVNDAGDPIPVQTRDEHVPVLYMLSRNPSGDDVDTTGLDLAWSPERMASKLLARDAGRARVSDLFFVVTGKNAEYGPLGFAITLPVYEGGIVPIDSAQRRQKIIGYIAGIYSVEELTKAQVTSLTANGFNVQIRDSINNENRLLIESGKPSGYTTETEISVYGSSLFLGLTATTAMVNGTFHVVWLTLPFSLLLFGAIIFYFLDRQEQQNKKLNDALLQLEAALEEVEALKKREKENIYRATVHGTQHIIHNLVNQLTLVSMEISRHADFNPNVVHSFENMKAQAIDLVNQLSSVEDIEEHAIKESIRPKQPIR